MRLDYPGNAIHVSANGKYMAVGCLNGNVLIVDPKTLVVTFTFKDRDKSVSAIKFSPGDSEILSVAYAVPSCEVLVYNVKNHFKLEHKLRASSSTVTHMDYSKDGKYMICNNKNMEILLFDLTAGKQLDKSKYSAIKDEKWETWTCIFGWPVQGVWPPCSNGGDINATDRSPNESTIVTADDFSKLKVFKYPCATPNSAFVSFSGHSAQVTNV